MKLRNCLFRRLFVTIILSVLCSISAVYAEKSASGNEPTKAVPSEIDLPVDFKPTNDDFAKKMDKPHYKGRFMGMSGFKGRNLKPIDGLNALYVAAIKTGLFADDPVAVGDVIIGIEGERLEEDPIIHIKQAVVTAEKGDGFLKLTRWRKGKIEKVTLDFNPKIPDLTKGGKIDHFIQWTLGSTGAKGWIFKHKNATTKARQSGSPSRSRSFP